MSAATRIAATLLAPSLPLNRRTAASAARAPLAHLGRQLVRRADGRAVDQHASRLLGEAATEDLALLVVVAAALGGQAQVGAMEAGDRDERVAEPQRGHDVVA